MIGQIFGNYKIEQKLGEGGMGEVFRGLDMMLEREVAIKFLRPELASQPQVVERFRSEAVTLAKLNHPNVATLFNFMRQGESFIMVLEFVRGVTLDNVIQQRGAIPVEQAVPIFCQVLDGIQHAHDFGIVHRDIKPANMMLTEKGTLKVLDFGIARILGTARMTRQGNIIGTIEYMSPEQVRGMETDARSDIYSLGMLLYEMLTGRCPFEIQNEFELMKAQIEQYPVPPRQLNPAIPEVVEQAIWRSVQKDPAQRFQSAAEFRTFLLTAGFAATGRLEPLAVGDPNPYATRPLNTQPPFSNPNLGGYPTVPSQSGFTSQPGVSNPSQPGLPTPSQPGLSNPSQPGYSNPSQPGYASPSNPGVMPPPAQHTSNPGADPLGATLLDMQLPTSQVPTPQGPTAQLPNSKETRVSTPAQFSQQRPASEQPAANDSMKATRIGTSPAQSQQFSQQQQSQQFAPQQQFAQQPGFPPQQPNFQPGPQPAQQRKKSFMSSLTWVHFAGAGVAALLFVGVLAGAAIYFVSRGTAEPVKPAALNQPEPGAQPSAQPTAAASEPQPSPETASQPSPTPQEQTPSSGSQGTPGGGTDFTQSPPPNFEPLPTPPGGTSGGDRQTADSARQHAPKPSQPAAAAPKPRNTGNDAAAEAARRRAAAKAALDQ
jgi:serine/threonine protein kinase